MEGCASPTYVRGSLCICGPLAVRCGLQWELERTKPLDERILPLEPILDSGNTGVQIFVQDAKMRRDALIYGKKCVVIMDTSFDVDDKGDYLFTLLAPDEFGSGRILAMAIIDRQQRSDFRGVLDGLRAVMQTIDPEWEPSCGMMDCDPQMADAFGYAQLYTCGVRHFDRCTP